MENPELFNESNEATYCPEDNKLRLYVGRVPRDEYLALKKEGWTSTPKQDCDFVAVWTIRREDTALSYAGVIGDEDQSPTDRAADRAERFAEYRDKRRAEAHGYADRFESIDLVHGFQSQDRADRAAARHERIGAHAYNQWEKAEYWQSRTAGVIAHALYLCRSSVRLGRIKLIEAEKRKAIDSYTPKKGAPVIDQEPWYCPVCGELYCKDHLEAQQKVPHVYCGAGRGGSWVRVAALPAIEKSYQRFIQHCDFRLLYERQMIEAVGGMAGEEEISVGGRFNGAVVFKVNKSNATSRVTSIEVLANKPQYSWIETKPICGYYIQKWNIERSTGGAYTAPVPEDIALVEKVKAELKSKNKKKTVPLINPTAESARQIQKRLNEKAASSGWTSERNKPKILATELKEMDQAKYSAYSKGSYAHYETECFTERGTVAKKERYSRGYAEPVVFKLRILRGGIDSADRVIIIADKPQKALPIVEEVTA